jgi:hypothetical protein
MVCVPGQEAGYVTPGVGKTAEVSRNGRPRVEAVPQLRSVTQHVEAKREQAVQAELPGDPGSSVTV